jgi:hypothetical protein
MFNTKKNYLKKIYSFDKKIKNIFNGIKSLKIIKINLKIKLLPNFFFLLKNSI